MGLNCTCEKMEESTTIVGADSVEYKICDVFLKSWSEIQSDIVSVTYLLDPRFVDNSKHATSYTIKCTYQYSTWTISLQRTAAYGLKHVVFSSFVTSALPYIHSHS